MSLYDVAVTVFGVLVLPVAVITALFKGNEIVRRLFR